MDSPTQLPSPEHYSNAEEYIRDRLSIADRPLSPSGLADEYECGNIHMRKELSRLSNEGVVERVSRGQYTLSETSESSESVMSHDESHGRDGNPTSNTDENTNDNQRRSNDRIGFNSHARASNESESTWCNHSNCVGLVGRLTAFLWIFDTTIRLTIRLTDRLTVTTN